MTGNRLRMGARVVLALALLVARAGAEEHTYSHLATDTPSLPDTTQSCGDCLSFVPLLSAVGGSQHVLLVHRWDVGNVVSTQDVAVSCLSRPSPFQSRAPPVLL